MKHALSQFFYSVRRACTFLILIMEMGLACSSASLAYNSYFHASFQKVTGVVVQASLPTNVTGPSLYVCTCVCVCSHWTRLVLREEGRGRDKGENFWKFTAHYRYDGPFNVASVPMCRLN